MKCVIADDEKLARNLIESYVEKVPFLELVASCKNGIEAGEILQNEEVDLLITDIQMPELLGTDLVKSLQNPPMVIFTTAYEDYAVEGFELNAIDYLLKPFAFDRFLAAVNKAKDHLDSHSSEKEVKLKKDYLTIKADHKLYKVQYKDIKFIEGQREYVSFHIPTGRITALMSLKKLEESLPSSIFIRCHKSYIVNKDKVEALEGNGLVIEEKTIPIGQSYKEKVVEEVF
ncbi:LytTR family DNA-binding domain-containing protein [Paracrocinitomix mangrovi]|uniref:LytR/AlgR family response regulator transcription factor n=1 Tax=Paracrocinitomix mangrovi TaxID=2862509 RepID=UPI001ED9E517|nr:LytTR family DNA-binding domain-containing protein [Paracrocinitomix mangrovi]UKN03361.1 LytTR family DNA-binding domain-containing protein [Paracrocinitomix mangrovi]